MQTTRQPYELLVRWDRNGHLAGAHAQFRYVITDDTATVIAESLGSAESVAVAGQNGFPLDDVLSKTLVAALASLESATAERDALAARLAAITSTESGGGTFSR